MAERRSRYAEHPDHRVELAVNPSRVRVLVDGEILADSDRTVRVRETAHDPVLYFRREDVRSERLERTEHRTFCPFKGEASYWSIRGSGRVETNAVWSYETPFPEVAGLAGLLAFFPDRVEWIFDAPGSAEPD
jgi:uncharacterized protein (DUF427 family)